MTDSTFHSALLALPGTLVSGISGIARLRDDFMSRPMRPCVGLPRLVVWAVCASHDGPTFQFEKLGVQGLWVTTHDLVSRYVYPPSHFHQACGVSQLHDTKPEFQVDTSVITVKGSM